MEMLDLLVVVDFLGLVIRLRELGFPHVIRLLSVNVREHQFKHV